MFGKLTNSHYTGFFVYQMISKSSHVEILRWAEQGLSPVKQGRAGCRYRLLLRAESRHLTAAHAPSNQKQNHAKNGNAWWGVGASRRQDVIVLIEIFLGHQPVPLLSRQPKHQEFPFRASA